MLFTIPSRYLSAIGQQVVFRLARWSWRIHTGFLGPRATRAHSLSGGTHYDYGTLTLYGQASKPVRLYARTSPRWFGRTTTQGPTTPNTQPLPGITRARFSPIRVRSPLLTESLLFSLPAGTEMFHFPAFPPTGLCVQPAVTRSQACGVSPFGHPGLNVRLSTPPGLSQIPTSFIGSCCQGIHHAP